MNLIPATVGERQRRHARSRSHAAAASRSRLPLADAPRGAARHAGREVILGIRPEAITDRDGADRKRKADRRSSTAMVEVVEPAGSDTFVVTHLGGKEVIGAHARRRRRAARADACRFAFNLDKAVLFDPAERAARIVAEPWPIAAARHLSSAPGIGGATLAAGLAGSGARDR